jgi:hypothetical protein
MAAFCAGIPSNPDTQRTRCHNEKSIEKMRPQHLIDASLEYFNLSHACQKTSNKIQLSIYKQSLRDSLTPAISPTKKVDDIPDRCCAFLPRLIMDSLLFQRLAFLVLPAAQPDE